MAFPTTSVLDNFDRADEGPPPGSGWSSVAVSGASSQLRVVSDTVKTDSSSGSGVYASTYGPDCEVYLTIAAWGANAREARIYLRLQEEGATTVDGYLLVATRFDAITGGLLGVWRLDNNVETRLGSNVNDTSGLYTGGEKFGLSAISDVLSVYENRGSWGAASFTRTDATYSGSGKLGAKFSFGDVAGDDFGGGTIGGSGNTYTKAGCGVIG